MLVIALWSCSGLGSGAEGHVLAVRGSYLFLTPRYDDMQHLES